VLADHRLGVHLGSQLPDTCRHRALGVAVDRHRPVPARVDTTESSTPLLDENGFPVGNDRVTGATTIELTPQERQQASTGAQLWAQGGTPSDPVLTGKFPGPEYAFGALRCATDNLNGDNVEFIYFPAGVNPCSATRCT
jgi:hypothetical protein